jgi:lysophospholipase L1-like esterase
MGKILGKGRKRLAAGAVGVALLLAANEIGLRMFLGLGSPPLSHADPDYGYAFNANQNLKRFGRRVFYNEQGLRSEPLPAVKPRGELRVLCIGDSVTNGGVLTDQSETYPYRLEAELRRAGIEARALNASAGSWGVENELAWLKKRGLFESDVVILQVGTHDLAQRKHSGEKVGKDISLPDHPPLLATWELIERYGLPRLAALVTGPPQFAGPTKEDHRVCMRVIGEMIEHVRKNRATPVVLLTPDREELENPRRSEGWRGDLRELVTQMEAPLVDMLVRFRAEPDRGLGAFRDEVHPNERGNRLMAHAVAEQILALWAAGALTSERAPAAR